MEECRAQEDEDKLKEMEGRAKEEGRKLWEEEEDEGYNVG